MNVPKPFAEIQSLYEWKKNTETVTVCHSEKLGPWPWSGSMQVKCDEETAYEMGKVSGWLQAIEEVYGL